MSDPQTEALRDCYSLHLNAPTIWTDLDLILLKNHDPATLTAWLRRDSALPAGVTEGNIRITIEASDGFVKQDNVASERVEAVWTPPNVSDPVEVTTTLEVDLEIGGSGSHKRFRVKKQIALNYLPPISSQLMLDGIIDGYEVGNFPDPTEPSDSLWPSLHPDRYQPPRFYYKISQDTKPLRISPHVQLGYFAIDYPWGSLGMPQYVSIDLNLIEKIEALLELINKDGRFKATGIKPIYGYRSPYFNQGTRNARPEETLKVKFSMHQYGRAMDFIIDETGDDIMDDLNGDGKVDVYDAAEIMHYVNILDRQYREEGRMEMVGGAGIYEFHDFKGRVQTPYLHMDTRGFVKDSGDLIRWKEPNNRWPDGSSIYWSRMRAEDRANASDSGDEPEVDGGESDPIEPDQTSRPRVNLDDL